jgi:hypothetical protein
MYSRRMFFVIIGLLLWSTSMFQAPSSPSPLKLSLRECTLSVAQNEFLYAPTACLEKEFGCSAQTWLTLNGVPFESAIWTVNVTGI